MADAGDERSLTRVSRLARAAAEVAVDGDTHLAGRVRLLESARVTFAGARRDERLPRPTAFRVAAAVAALAAILALAFGLDRYREYRERPLSYEVRGNASSAANYISARDDAPADVHFSDGSDVVLSAGTRLRIDETKPNGARVLVERGGATASVRHRPDSSWLFIAGPFEVHVTGTKLTIAWDPENERVDVTLHEGSVEIETPIGPSHYAVTAGHRFHASVRDGSIKLDQGPVAELAPKREAANRHSELAPKPVDATSMQKPGETAPGERTSAKSGAADAPRTTADPAISDESWSKRVRRGAFTEVVRAARTRGVADCLASCSSADLRALADAARYTGESALATEALLALRSRFKGSYEGGAAAFLLGHTAESTGNLAAADRWYATYLSESPGGALAAEALAGRMLVASRSGASARAQELARDYLKRYPDGAAARAARKLAGSY
jgi:TolA-binding protein